MRIEHWSKTVRGAFRLMEAGSAISFCHDFLFRRNELRTYSLRSGLKVKMWNNTDRLIFSEIFIHQDYGIVPENSVVIDVGAHIGIFALYVSDRAQQIYAFEPDLQNQQKFIINLGNQPGLKSRGTISPLAIAKRKGVARFYRHKENTGGHSLIAERLSEREIHKAATFVNTDTLDHALAECGFFNLRDKKLPVVLKLDCEGMEFPILKSLSDRLIHRISLVILEFDSAQSEYTAEDAIGFLKAHNFNVKYKDGIIVATSL